MTATFGVGREENKNERCTHGESLDIKDGRFFGTEVSVQRSTTRVVNLHVEHLLQSAVVTRITLDNQAVLRLIADHTVAQRLRRTGWDHIEETGLALSANFVARDASHASVAELCARSIDSDTA